MKDVRLFERVQRRFTRMRDYSCNVRVEKLGLFCLEQSRLRGDLMKVYTFITNLIR